MVSGVSLIDGWLPPTLLAVAAASTAAALWPQRRAWRRMRWPALAALVVVAVAVLVFGVFDPLQYRFPRSFYLWIGIAALVLAMAVTTWRDRRPLQRGTAVLAALATVLGAASLVNVHYAYYPTFAALRGQISSFEVDEHELVALREHAASTGRLPDSGVVIKLDVPATTSGFRARRAVAYLPPIWFAPDRPMLPVLVLLPGTPGNPGDWFRAGGADRVANDYALAHGGSSPILVLPDVHGSTFGDTECVDGPRGAAETYVIEDVTQYVVDVLGASPNGEHWGLVGLSAGGTCAMTIALRHPERFAAFANFGGDAAPNLGGRERTIDVLYGGDAAAWEAHDPTTLLADGSFEGMRAWFEVGRGDSGPRRAAEQLSDAAQAAGIETTLVIRGGGHSYAFWRTAFANAFDWLSDSVGLEHADIVS